MLAEQADAEQREPGDREPGAEPLAAGERHVREPRDHHREDPDPAGRDRLHERQRRERERRRRTAASRPPRTPNPISQRRFPSSERTDAIGRRSDSGGTFDATLCSSR